MYCPECRVEYRPGFTYCADCQVALVEELAPDEKQVREPVTVYEGNDPVMLALAETILNDAEIPFLVAGGDTTARTPLNRPADPQWRIVQVPAGSADEARDLLSEMPEEVDEDAADSAWNQ